MDGNTSGDFQLGASGSEWAESVEAWAEERVGIVEIGARQQGWNGYYSSQSLAREGGWEKMTSISVVSPSTYQLIDGVGKVGCFGEIVQMRQLDCLA